MAGTVTHLVIADQLLEPLGINNPALFYCGSLAPDAIMAREGYQREMKRHTHFKDGIHLKELHLPDCYDKYRRASGLSRNSICIPAARTMNCTWVM